MSAIHSWCDSEVLQLSPMNLTSRLSNSALSEAVIPSSVVQTGVKSFGCEKRMPQLLPRCVCRLSGPIEVSASKLGTSSPIRSTLAPAASPSSPMQQANTPDMMMGNRAAPS